MQLCEVGDRKGLISLAGQYSSTSTSTITSTILGRLNRLSAKIDRQFSQDRPVSVKDDLVVKIGDHADVIRNIPNSFSYFGFACRAGHINDAVLFAKPGNAGIRIVWKEAVPISLARW